MDAKGIVKAWNQILEHERVFIKKPSPIQALTCKVVLEEWVKGDLGMGAYIETAKRKIKIYGAYRSRRIGNEKAVELITKNLSLPDDFLDESTFKSYSEREYPMPVDEHHETHTGHLEDNLSVLLFYDESNSHQDDYTDPNNFEEDE